MKRKKTTLAIGNQVCFRNSGAYDKSLTHTIISRAAVTADEARRIFKLRGSDRKERFALEAELRLASSRERY